MPKDFIPMHDAPAWLILLPKELDFLEVTYTHTLVGTLQQSSSGSGPCNSTTAVITYEAKGGTDGTDDKRRKFAKVRKNQARVACIVVIKRQWSISFELWYLRVWHRRPRSTPQCSCHNCTRSSSANKIRPCQKESCWAIKKALNDLYTGSEHYERFQILHRCGEWV